MTHHITFKYSVQDDITVLALICTLILSGAILLGARMIAEAIRGESESEHHEVGDRLPPGVVGRDDDRPPGDIVGPDESDMAEQ